MELPIGSPPTDNLYKYMAITGLWLLLGFSFLILFTFYNSYMLEGRSNLTTSLTGRQRWLTDIEARITSLKVGDFDKNKLDFLGSIYKNKPKQELLVLEGTKKFAQSQIDELKTKLAKIPYDPSEAFKWERRLYIFIWLPSALAGSLILTIVGFHFWYKMRWTPLVGQFAG